MKLICADGPLKEMVVETDLRVGDQISLALPVEPIERDEPIYHPFLDEARARMTQKRVLYLVTESELRFCK